MPADAKANAARASSASHGQHLWAALRNLLPWALFLSAAALLLRPVLITAVTADDLINPFSQTYHAGTSIDPIMRRTWHFVSVTGHFNYIGQSIGSFVVLIWTYLIGNFGFRYSTVYAVTKFAAYVACILLGAELIRRSCEIAGLRLSKWHCRLWVLVGVAGVIQLHVPWSNDPVASYPLAGYLTAAIGFSFLLLVVIATHKWTWKWSLGGGLFGSFAVLYYEFNSFAVLAAGPLLALLVWRGRDTTAEIRRRIAHAALLVGPAAVTTVYFFLRNRAASAAYSGTAVSLTGRFPTTFMNGMISAFPGSSWPIAKDWLGTPVNVVYPSIRNFLLGAVCLAALLVLLRKETRIAILSGPADKPFVGTIAGGLLIYWVGATFSQTSTVKIQDEAKRIGQVYNYYAIAATCLAMIVILALVFVPWKRVGRIIVAGLGVVLFTFAGYQYALNWNVLAQFNAIMKPSRDLLAAYADQPPMADRCQALDRWKLMGWPEYYWLDMELGLNRSNEIYRGEPFCQR